MKRIICFPFDGDKIGGSHILSIEIIKSLKKVNTIEPVVVLHKKGKLLQLLKKNHINYDYLPLHLFTSKIDVIKNFLKFIKSTYRIKYYLLKKKIDIIHSNNTNIHLNWLLPGKLAKTKIIWHLHARFPNWPLFKLFSKGADKFLLISEFVEGSIPEKMKKKSFLIKNAIKFQDNILKDSKDDKKIEKFFKDHKNYKIILFLGNFSKRKRPLFFIQIAKKIKLLYKKKIIFLMIGDNREFTKNFLLNNIRKLNLYKYFFITNFKRNNYKIISKSHALIATSVDEPFGLTLLEAMYNKTPIIASNSGGHREIIKNGYNGFLIEEKNIVLFAKKTVEILQNKKLKNLILNNASNEVIKNYEFSKYMKKLINFYKNI